MPRPEALKTQNFSFHHPIAFWAGCIAIIGGVLAHVPMFMMGKHTGYQMVDMEMDAAMLALLASRS